MTKKQFRAYLQANLNETFKRRTPWSCPLACYLGETYDDVSVVSEEMFVTSRLTHRESHLPLPKWAQEFIKQVDCDDAPGMGREPITGAQALALLEAA